MAGLSLRVPVRIPPHVPKSGVDDELFLVNMPEGEPEDHGEDGTRDGGTGKGPGKIGVLDGRGRGETDGGGDGGHEEVDGGHETLHVLGRARVGDGVGGDVDKDLGDSAEDHGDGIEGDWYGGEGWGALLFHTV